jgi:hypothetical protein
MADVLAAAPFGTATLVDGDFLAALWRSPTFLDPDGLIRLASPLAATLVLAAGLLVVSHRAGRRRYALALHRDEGGAATMIDFVLVTPVFVFFMFLVFQYSILAKNHLFTHYAAYQAARSARVYLCPEFPLSLGDAADRAAGIAVCDSDAAQEKAEFAARLAMIPAAPYRRLKCQSDCGQAPLDAVQSLAQANGLSRRVRAMREQTRYMFDRDNVKVSIKRAPMALFTAANHSPQTPVTAIVEARIMLIDYTGRIFADGKRKDGHYYVISRAEVSLL